MCTEPHASDDEKCWCNPTLFYKDERTGVEVWVHHCFCKDPPSSKTLAQAVRRAMTRVVDKQEK
jgi:hypothetical protein